MARIFITGSADGLGQAAARRLVALGHGVVLHGRNRDRAQQALGAVPGALTALDADLASIEQTRELAGQANAAGPFQAVIHNAGVYRPGTARRETVDGLAARRRPATSSRASPLRCGWLSARSLRRR